MKVFAFALLSIAACVQPAACPEPPIVVVVADSGTLTDEASSRNENVCKAACTNLARLGCPEAELRPGEDPCYVVCERAEATGGRVDVKPKCVAAAKNKTELLACRTYRCM